MPKVGKPPKPSKIPEGTIRPKPCPNCGGNRVKAVLSATDIGYYPRPKWYCQDCGWLSSRR